MTSEHDQLHIHFQFHAAGEGEDSLIGSPEEDAIIAWLEEELHWPQPPAEGPCVWKHRVADEIPATRLCPALPWCDSLPRKDAEDKWSRIMAMLPEWLQSYPVFEAFGFITNDDNFDDRIKGFVLREGTMTEFELPPRCGCKNS